MIARLRRNIVDGLMVWQLVGCLCLLLVGDRLYDRAGDSFVPGGPLDEFSHILTALLFLQVMPRRARDLGPFWVLLGSFAIDFDHIPGYLGHDFLTAGTPRPYTHSLLTLMVLAGVGLLWRQGRRPLWGFALGVTLHFVRDLAEGSGAGVSLLWPFTDHAFHYGHSAYIGLMVAVTGVGVALAAERGRRNRRAQARAGEARAPARIPA